MGIFGKRISLFQGITDKKKLEWLGIIVVVVLIVLIGWPVFAKNNTTTTTQTSSSEFDATREQHELEAILSTIKGAGKVKVLITYETTTEMVPAYDSDTTISSSNGTQNETQSQKPATGSDGTIVLTQRRPKILGVVVVAEGASNMSVKLMLSQAVQTSLGVTASKVEVFEMKP